MVLEFGTFSFRAPTIAGIIATASRSRISGVVDKIVDTVKPTNGPGGKRRAQTGGIVRVVFGTMEEALETKLSVCDG